MLFQTPELDMEDAGVLAAFYARRDQLAASMRVPKRWPGLLRRNLMARAIQGSNSIEGYTVETDDAAAAVDYEDALTADKQTFAEIQGYRQALGYVLALAAQRALPGEETLKALHFMLLGHDLGKSPGRYRTGPIYVSPENGGPPTDIGPPPEMVPALMGALPASIADGGDALVRGAMAHLNLVMIHPFRDGNGRMGRALQTLVVASSGVAEPVVCSVEEWLGRHTDDYYRILAATGAGSWNPGRNAQLWIKFMLRAHELQAQRTEKWLRRTEFAWTRLDEIVAEQGLPERTADVLYDALNGFRIRRSSYLARAQIDQRVASRDLKALVDQDFLIAHGQTTARHYIAGPKLQQLRAQLRAEIPHLLTDPYPWLRAELLRRTSAGLSA